MFDIGWVEMVVIIIVMIVVIGPKDLPRVLHTIGQWVARARAMARSFQDSIEEMARDTGLDEMQREVRNIRDFSLEDEIEKSIDPEGELREGLSLEAPDKPSPPETTAPETALPEAGEGVDRADGAAARGKPRQRRPAKSRAPAKAKEPASPAPPPEAPSAPAGGGSSTDKDAGT